MRGTPTPQASTQNTSQPGRCPSAHPSIKAATMTLHSITHVHITHRLLDGVMLEVIRIRLVWCSGGGGGETTACHPWPGRGESFGCVVWKHDQGFYQYKNPLWEPSTPLNKSKRKIKDQQVAVLLKHMYIYIILSECDNEKRVSLSIDWCQVVILLKMRTKRPAYRIKRVQCCHHCYHLHSMQMVQLLQN